MPWWLPIATTPKKSISQMMPQMAMTRMITTLAMLFRVASIGNN